MNWLGNLRRRLTSKRGNSRPQKRPYTVAQIEITSHCVMECQFCPQTLLRDRWLAGNMDLALYKQSILPDLNLFDMVYLQGWGEPLLHPGLWEMLALAQAQGCRTGFTTNGLALTARRAEKIVELQVDIISCSLAGASVELHESLRRGSSFDQIIKNLQYLLSLRNTNGNPKPWVELHFLMTRRNLHELPAFVNLAAELGVDEVVATNLTYTPVDELDQQRVFGNPPEDWALELVAQAESNARQQKLPLRIYPLEMNPEVLVCDADPLNTVYIGQSGEVAPCVYLGLSVPGKVPRYFAGQPAPVERYIYGSVTQGLDQVMHGPRRKNFTQSWAARNLHASPIAGLALLAGENGGAALPDPPEPCQQCYKRYGV